MSMRNLGLPAILTVASIVLIMAGFAICSDSNVSKAGDNVEDISTVEMVTNGMDGDLVEEKLADADSDDVQKVVDDVAKESQTETKTKDVASKKVEKSNLSGTWPSDDELAAKVPKPLEGNVKTSQTSGNVSAIYLTMTYDQCKKYIDEIIEDGYQYDQNEYDEFVSKKNGEVQFGYEDGTAFKVSYTIGMVKIIIYGY